MTSRRGTIADIIDRAEPGVETTTLHAAHALITDLKRVKEWHDTLTAEQQAEFERRVIDAHDTLAAHTAPHLPTTRQAVDILVAVRAQIMEGK